jgi:hypothetical protein
MKLTEVRRRPGTPNPLGDNIDRHVALRNKKLGATVIACPVIACQAGL